MVHCCEGIANSKHIWGDKESGTYTHQAQGKYTVYVFKLKTRCVPTNCNHSRHIHGSHAMFKRNFNINITTQPTTHRTMLRPNIVQLLKKNEWVAIIESFASMQQHCRLVNWVVVLVSNILPIEIKRLQQTSNMESFNDLKLDYHSQHM
jgi:hypothetical protein